VNKRIIFIFAIIIVAILVFSFLILPLLGLAPFSASMQGQWYNGEDPVGNPFAFVNPGGSEVTNLRVTVTWNAAGVNVDEDTFGLGGWIKVSLRQAERDTVEIIELERFSITKSGASNMAGSAYGNFVLSSLLSGYMDQLTWNIIIEAELSASVEDLSGETLTDTWDSGQVSYILSWSELDSSFSLVGSVSGGQ